MATLKYSRQRESIKEFLMTRKDHPTADVVYENVKKIYPNISLGTVYRNLSLLSDLGEIQNVVDNAQQGVRRCADLGEVVPLAGRELGLQRQMGHADDAVHGRTDFVAHVGEKIALGA